MASEPRTPWHPDRRWADSLIALLALLALLAVGLALRARQQSALRPSQRVSLQGRILEVTLAGPRSVGLVPLSDKDWTKAEGQLKEPWDRALLAALRAELEGSTQGTPLWVDGATPQGPGGAPFRRVVLAAHGAGPMPERAEREEVHRRLGKGYAADLLEARLLDREGGEGGERLRAQARKTLLLRLAGLGLMGLLVMGMAAGGLALGIYLLATRQQPPSQSLPAWSLSGRAAILVFLGWFLAFFLASNLAGLLVLPFPSLRWMALPLGYLLHAVFGCWLLCRAEGLSVAALWRRVAPDRMGRNHLAWGGGFLALAIFLVLAVALTANLILKPDQSPQRDLQELLRSLSGWGPNLALFLTVAALAPLFEELLFRGFLLPVLARERGMATALLISSLLFGAIHLQPTGLPALGTLGLVMGLAMRHTGSLWTPILVHAGWNGSLFLLMRAFA